MDLSNISSLVIVAAAACRCIVAAAVYGVIVGGIWHGPIMGI